MKTICTNMKITKNTHLDTKNIYPSLTDARTGTNKTNMDTMSLQSATKDTYKDMWAAVAHHVPTSSEEGKPLVLSAHSISPPPSPIPQYRIQQAFMPRPQIRD